MHYRPDQDRAPRVTAKGSGIVAERIVDMARRHDVPIREDKDLIQVLSQLDPDQEIPSELYWVVAEILSFVYWSARDYRQQMAESYERLGNLRHDAGDMEGARRNWRTAQGIRRDLDRVPGDSDEF